MDPTTKPGAGEPPHETWRNRDYGNEEEAAPRSRFWLQATFVALMLFMLAGMMWSGILEPLLK